MTSNSLDPTVRGTGIGALIAVTLTGLPVWLLLAVHESVKMRERSVPDLKGTDIPNLNSAYITLTVAGHLIHGVVSVVAILIGVVGSWRGMPPRRLLILWVLVALVILADLYLGDVTSLRMAP